MIEEEIKEKTILDPMAVRQAPDGPAEPVDFDWPALRKVATVLEKINLAEWVAIMNSPTRSFWVNFWAGLARGIGMVVGATLVGIVFALFSVGLLKKAFMHAGGVPWVGSEMRQAIGFVLKVVRNYQSAP